jgi:hypothetical protein
MRLHQHALWFYSYMIFCYRILYFHPLSSRSSNKIVLSEQITVTLNSVRNVS